MSRPGFRITKAWIFVGVGEDDEEGVCGVSTAMGIMPLVATDERRRDLCMAAAQDVANVTGKTIRLIRLDTRTDEQVIEPAPKDGSS